jgi:hypothetical protein
LNCIIDCRKLELLYEQSKMSKTKASRLARISRQTFDNYIGYQTNRQVYRGTIRIASRIASVFESELEAFVIRNTEAQRLLKCKKDEFEALAPLLFPDDSLTWLIEIYRGDEYLQRFSAIQLKNRDGVRFACDESTSFELQIKKVSPGHVFAHLQTAQVLAALIGEKTASKFDLHGLDLERKRFYVCGRKNSN